MSRNVEAKSSVRLTSDETELRNTNNGKLIFTAYQKRNCAMLIQNDRLISACFYSANASKVGAIYIAKIKNIVKNINACFVEIEKGEICYLPLDKVAYPYLLNRAYDGRLLEGDELLIQIERDAQKTKQPTATTKISLSNDYFVISLADTDSTAFNFSSKLNEKQKQFITNLIGDSLSVANGNILIRTKAGECDNREVLLHHFNNLANTFLKLLSISRHRNCFTCLKAAPKDYISVIQSIPTNEYEEIITDNPELYSELMTYSTENPLNASIRLYQDSMLTLSSLYSLATKMDMALERRIWLKSGGYLIIEHTEAMTVIDVNTGKYEAGKSASETYKLINTEAAEEIARQLRLRNLSGIIIVDFINMSLKEDKIYLLNYLKELVKKDIVKTTIVDMTPLGLVEITRKKVNKTLREQFYQNEIN